MLESEGSAGEYAFIAVKEADAKARKLEARVAALENAMVGVSVALTAIKEMIESGELVHNAPETD